MIPSLPVDFPAITVSWANGAEAADPYSAAAPTGPCATREVARIWCAAGKNSLTGAMSARSWRTAPRDFIGRTTMARELPKLRPCSFKSTERRNSWRYMISFTNSTISRKHRKFWDRIPGRDCCFWSSIFKKYYHISTL